MTDLPARIFFRIHISWGSIIMCIPQAVMLFLFWMYGMERNILAYIFWLPFLGYCILCMLIHVFQLGFVIVREKRDKERIL